jgi:hypothetical protein
MRSVFGSFGITILTAITALSAGAAEARLAVDGTEFVLTQADDRVLRGADLIGAALKIRRSGNVFDLTIQSVEEDPHAKGGRVLLYADGKIADLCNVDAAGRSLGFPVPGGRGSFELTCTSGVIGKCVRWGYRFWEEKPGGPPLRALHQACTRMARADYGGDGQPATRDGMLIDLYDRFGIQTPGREASMTFEAAWGVDGAICVAHPRVPENISLEQLAGRYPRLKSQLGPAVCTEEAAMRNPDAVQPVSRVIERRPMDVAVRRGTRPTNDGAFSADIRPGH